MAFDKKYVWMPNINIPTIPLKKPKYFAPWTPSELLNKTEKGSPYFWEGLPIKFEKIYTNNDPIIEPNNTTKEFKL